LPALVLALPLLSATPSPALASVPSLPTDRVEQREAVPAAEDRGAAIKIVLCVIAVSGAAVVVTAGKKKTKK
jgi:hypothetical protein